MAKRKAAPVEFSQPGTYRIKIQGVLDEKLSERLGGMVIKLGKTSEGAPVTTLFGSLQDQAALLGVQTALYELHLPVLSVERV